MEFYILGKLVIFVSGLLFQGQYLYCKKFKVSVPFLMKIRQHNVISSLTTCRVLVCLPRVYHVVNVAQFFFEFSHILQILLE